VKHHKIIQVTHPGVVLGVEMGHPVDNDQKRWIGTRINQSYDFWEEYGSEWFWVPRNIKIDDIVVVATKDQPHSERHVWVVADFDDRNLLLTKGRLL